ncbi:MAG: U32 family peptidase [Eubacteriales bacterium]|nr:U32 family peptidase [Eubacteriales bacterium]
MNTSKFNRPELLAPGGDLQALQVAVRNGADAVYFGLDRFSARTAAKNLTSAQLPEALHFLHEHSARGYLALNTLMRDDELPLALDLAREAFQAGIDAIIVQDLGLAAMIHQDMPTLVLHGSTQMSLSSEADLELAKQLHLKRLVLPRELSGTELHHLTDLATLKNLETEAFIHGALCVSYSGQCLMSSLIGGRSGNRGACAQPCRLDYNLNGQDGALYSPKDQSLLPFLPDIVTTQLTSLKIEGRMRGPAYVGQVVAVYKEALDQLETLHEQGLSQDEILAYWPELIKPGLQKLRQAFNRGGDFTAVYWQGNTYNNLMVKGLPGSYGVQLGAISRIDAHQGNLWIETEGPLLPGDVISVRRKIANQPEKAVASAPIGTVRPENQQLVVRCFHPDVLRELLIGDTVYRMTDNLSEQQTLKADLRKTAISMELTSSELVATIRSGIFVGLTAQVSYLADPQLNPLRAERAKEQLRKTGGTPFRVDDVKITGEMGLVVSQLNQLRRDVLEQLALKLHKRPDLLPLQACVEADDTVEFTQATSTDASESLTPLADEVAAFFYQIPVNPADLACGADLYELPLLALDQTRITAIVQTLKALEPQAKIIVYWPPVVTGDKSPIVTDLIEQAKTWPIDGVSTSWPEPPFSYKIADVSANLFNGQSLTTALNRGADTVCPSLELNGEQLSLALSSTTWPMRPITLERPLYGRLRLMTTAYCPIGKNAVNCHVCVQSDRPDDSKTYTMIDRKQNKFQILPHPRTCQADLLNSDLLMVPEEYLQLRANLPSQVNWRHRLIFLDEKPQERRELIKATRQLQQTPNQTTAEAITSIAKRLATRLDCRLTSGHFQRGVI